ncbi:hypothetical protein IPM62_02255 [Candidatus Woesebacteria bacterium]|nr:MAG: hypothetical protein IPM62_02255 [Candidatus Woesebacteria bacterium]
MSEGMFHPESARQGEITTRERERVAEVVQTPEPVVTISGEQLRESQTGFAIGRGFEKFEDMPPIERAVFLDY